MDKNLKNYILDCINGEPYGVSFGSYAYSPYMEEKQKVRFLLKMFSKEFLPQNSPLSQVDGEKMLESYLMGLPSCFDLAFAYNDIAGIHKMWSESSHLGGRERFIDNWFAILARGIIKLTLELRLTEWYPLFMK